MRNNLSELISRVSFWQSTRRSTRGEQPDEGVEVDEKNDQIALRRGIVALVMGEITIRQIHEPLLTSTRKEGSCLTF